MTRHRFRRRRPPFDAAPLPRHFSTRCYRLPRVGAPAVIPLTANGEEFAWIRVNQVGYLPDDPKIAVLSSDRPLEGAVSRRRVYRRYRRRSWCVGAVRAQLSARFHAVRNPGNYQVTFGEIASPRFAIGPDAYQDVPGKLLEFMRLQRCGDNPVTGKKCHQEDGFDTTTGEMVDLTGGWHDAGDRLKHMITTSVLCGGAVFWPGRRMRRGTGRRSSRKSIRGRMCIYVQIGDDRDHCRPTRSGMMTSRTTAAGRADRGRRGGRRASPRGRSTRTSRTGWRIWRAGQPRRWRWRATSKRLGRSISWPSRSRAARCRCRCGRPTTTARARTSTISNGRDRAVHRDQGREVSSTRRFAYAHQAGENPWMGNDRHGHYEFFPYVNLAHWRL